MPTEKKSAVGEKVLFGPTRPTGVRDPEADALGNCCRFVDVEPAGLADRVAECVRRGTPFYLNELVPRCNLRLDGDAMYQGRVRPAELADALRKAGPLYLGRMICGEYGGMLYWTKNSLDGRIYPRLPKARDLEEARRNFHRRVEEYAAREHAFGGGPYIGLCSGMCYPPIDSKAFDIPGLELEPGDPERLSAAVRQKRVVDHIRPTYRYAAMAVFVLALGALVFGVISILRHDGFSMYFVLFGMAFLFYSMSSRMLPTAKNNSRYVKERWEKALLASRELTMTGETPFPVPYQYAHPAVLDRMIRVIREGRAESKEQAYEIMKADLKALNSDVTVSQTEYDEVVAVKPLFLECGYRDELQETL